VDGPLYFDDLAALREWAAAHCGDEAEVVVGFPRVRYGAPPPAFRVADAAEAFAAHGWGEVGRVPVDDVRYGVRFGPVKQRARRAPAIPEDGDFEPPVLSAEYEARLRDDPNAWEFFEKQAPKYRRTAVWWVMSGKAPETRERRIAALIEASAKGERVAQLQRQM
jgi:hypothetical protein